MRIKARKFIKNFFFSHRFSFLIFQRIQKKSPKRFRITDFLFSKIWFLSLHIYLDIVLFNRLENLFSLLGLEQSLPFSFARLVGPGFYPGPRAQGARISPQRSKRSGALPQAQPWGWNRYRHCLPACQPASGAGWQGTKCRCRSRPHQTAGWLHPLRGCSTGLGFIQNPTQ